MGPVTPLIRITNYFFLDFIFYNIDGSNMVGNNTPIPGNGVSTNITGAPWIPWADDDNAYASHHMTLIAQPTMPSQDGNIATSSMIVWVFWQSGTDIRLASGNYNKNNPFMPGNSSQGEQKEILILENGSLFMKSYR